MSNKSFFEDKVLANIDQLKSGVAKTHDQFVKVSDETVEGVLEVGAQWQNILARSLKKGTKFLGTQQELVFETFEGIKNINQTNIKRIKQLVDIKLTKKTAIEVVKEEVTEAKEAVESTIKLAKEEVVEAKKTIRKEVKATKKEVKKDIEAVKKTVETVKAKVKNEFKSLRSINGIGPKLEGILNEAGIKDLTDLANTSAKKLEKVLEEAGPRYKSFSPQEWLDQVNDILKKKG